MIGKIFRNWHGSFSKILRAGIKFKMSDAY